MEDGKKDFVIANLQGTVRGQVEEITNLRRRVTELEGEVGGLRAENRALRADVEYWGRIATRVLTEGGFPLTDAALEAARNRT